MKYIDSQLLSGEHVLQAIPISRRGTYAEALMMTVPLLVWASVIYSVDSGIIGVGYVQSQFKAFTGLAISKNAASILTAITFALAIKLITGRSLIELVITSLFSVIFAPLFIINRVFGNERALTNMRLIRKTGILRTKFWDNTIERIQRSTYNQSLLGKLLNYGSVDVVDALGMQYTLDLVNRPADITKLLNTVAGRRSFTQAPKHELLLPGELATPAPELEGEHLVAAHLIAGDRQAD